MSFESDMEKFRNPDGGTSMSICWGDSYYYDSLVRKYGKKRVEDYLKKHPFIYDVPKNMW